MDNRITGLNSTERILNKLSLEDQLKFGFNIDFAECIIQRRKELGWTQAMLAEKSGVNRVTIAKLENFQRTASVEVVLKLLHALGLGIKFVNIEDK